MSGQLTGFRQIISSAIFAPWISPFIADFIDQLPRLFTRSWKQVGTLQTEVCTRRTTPTCVQFSLSLITNSYHWLNNNWTLHTRNCNVRDFLRRGNIPSTIVASGLGLFAGGLGPNGFKITMRDEGQEILLDSLKKEVGCCRPRPR